MSTTDPNPPQTSTAELRQLAAQLLADHQVLMRGLGCHQDWIRQLSEIGMPRFGELACRLEGFRTELAQHFRNEEQYGERLHVHGPEVSADTSAAAADGGRQHEQLLDRLSKLNQRLRRWQEEFRGWNAAVEEVGALVKEICEHEQHEMEILRNVTNGRNEQ